MDDQRCCSHMGGFYFLTWAGGAEIVGFFFSFQFFITFFKGQSKHGEMRVHIKSSPAPNFGFLILIM